MISIIIVAWNSHEDIQKLLLAIDKVEAKDKVEIIVVDNDSAELSKVALKRLQTQFVVLKKVFNDGNWGFSRGCNIGVSHSNGDVLLFLNPDTQVDVAVVLEVGAKIRQTNDYQIAGVQQISDRGVTRTCCRSMTRLNTLVSCSGLNKILGGVFRGFEMTEWDHQESRYVGHVIGAFYCMRKTSFEQLRGFDEEFFLYYEDLDLSTRATYAGMRIFYDAAFRIYHKGGGSSEKVGLRRLEYSIRSRDLIIGKHFGLTQQLFCRCVSIFIELPLRAIQLVVKGSLKEISQLCEMYGKMVFSTMRHR